MGNNETSRPLLTISLLVSNRPDTIPRCLDSVRAVLKEIPGELILVDTSGSEEIHRLLLTYTDQVIPFVWCNDFAKARNEGLRRAHGEWFLFLDDDEWIAEPQPLIDFFRNGDYRNYVCANYIVRNFYDSALTIYSDSWVSRMIKVTPDICFKGRIHEYLYGADGHSTTIPMRVYHTGYIYATEEDRRKHFERNAGLLKEMIQEEPDVLRWKVQLVQEYRTIRGWEEMTAFCRQCLAECAHVTGRYSNYDIGTFYAGAILGCYSTNRRKEGAALCEEALSDPRSSELSRANTYQYLALIAFGDGEWKKAEDCMHKYLALERELSREPDKLDEQKWALVVCDTFEERNMQCAYTILIVCGWKQRHLDALHKYFKKLTWDSRPLFELEQMPEYLIEAVATLPKDDVLDEMLALGWKQERMKLKLFACAEGWKGRDAKGYLRVLQSVSRITDSHWYPSYAAVVCAAQTGKRSKLPGAIGVFAEHLENIFFFPGEVRDIAAKNGISLEPYYLAVPFAQWKQNVKEYIETVETGDLRITMQELMDMSTKEDIHYDYALVRFAEKLAAESVHHRYFKEKQPLFRTYAQCTAILCRGYYQKDVTEHYLELLPDYVAAGVLIGKALEAEQGNLPESMRLYHRAAQMHPALQNAIKSYMVCLQLDAERKERHREEEFRNLLGETKRKAAKFLADGNVSAARTILAQLKQLAPDDLAVAELALRTRLAEG